MGMMKFGKMLITALVLLHGSASAVEFGECAKFENTDTQKYLRCAEYSFIEATQTSNYQKIGDWLRTNNREQKYYYDALLTTLMCGPAAEGKKPFKTADQQNIMNLTDQLLALGASFDAMPSSSIVTPLFCASNRQNSVILDHVLSRIKATTKDLDAVLYEGTDSFHIPLFRAVMNDDLASAKVLLKYGATPDFTVLDNQTVLKEALKVNNVTIANWLLDEGASVHIRDYEVNCEGKSALDYALDIPTDITGRDQLVKRIQNQTSLPSKFKDKCLK